MAMPRTQPWRSAPFLLALLLLLAAVAQAQEPPLLRLDATNYEVGDTATLQASGLEPQTDYELEILPPGEETVEEQLTTDDEGELTHPVEIDAAGDWTVRLSGEGVSGALSFTAVTADAQDDPAGESTSPSEEATGAAAASDEESAASDEPEPDEGASRAEETTPDDETPPGAEAAAAAVEEAAPVDEADSDGETATVGDAAADDESDADGAAAASDDASAGEDAAATEEDEAIAEEDTGEEQDSTIAVPGEDTPPQDIDTDEATDAQTDQTDTQTDPTDPQTEEPTGTQVTSVDVEDGAVVASAGADVAWRFDFPEGSGGTGAILELDDVVWVGHGNSAIAIDRETGEALRRHPMPGRVIRLEEAGTAVSAVSDLGDGIRQRIEIGPNGPRSTVRFSLDPETFEWLRNEADVADPAARLEFDPTSPWLHLAVGLATNDRSERQERLQEAVQRGSTFYDLAGIAIALEEIGETELANEAMDVALQDFARRGYDPRLLDDARVHQLYNFPLEPMERALANADLDSAGFWAPWLYLTRSSEAPETGQALAEYARQLETVGQSSAASLWRERADERGSSSPTASLEQFFLGLGSVGWYGVAAILAAILALHLTLIAKYWAPQSLAMRRRVETGGARRPWMRLFSIRYYSFTEKLVLILLFATSLVLLSLVNWYGAAGEPPEPLQAGTLASPAAGVMVAELPLEGERGAFIRGYSAHVTGETEVARQEYERAGNYPPALNNLAALTGDDALYQAALDQAAASPEAAFNLGRRADPSPFHASYRSDSPLLAVPGSIDFRTALTGSWQDSIADTFRNPWLALQGMDFFGLPQLLWQVLLALYLLCILITLVWLVIPRPAFARNAPRTVVYHLLALLIPGSGLADEAWGILLMVPWALLGVDVLSQLLGWEHSLGLDLQVELWALGAIYLINLIAFVVEFISYGRRMRELRRKRPEAVDAYTLRSA